MSVLAGGDAFLLCSDLEVGRWIEASGSGSLGLDGVWIWDLYCSACDSDFPKKH